jgi:GntR family transcriptional regulator
MNSALAVNVAMTQSRPGGKALPLRSGRVNVVVQGSRRDRAHEVRRLRDLLRTSVLRDDYPDGHLPSESQLMAAHGATRGTVREVLSLLRTEGLIERTQGVGTHVVSSSVTTLLDEAHGAANPTQDSIFNRRMRPRILGCATVAAPRIVARQLLVAPGTPCLRLDYVALLGDEPHGMATNYVLFPEAERLRRTPFVSDWYALLADAGIVLGDSEFVVGCVLADRVTAPVLDIREGAPLMVLEQTIRDPAGRVFDFAIVYSRADRSRFVSRASRESAVFRTDFDPRSERP